MRKTPNEGDTATLLTTYYGYRQILLVQKVEYMWEAEIFGNGKIIYVYEDEFVLD